MRGKEYKSFEKNVKHPPDWARVKKLVEKYCIDYPILNGLSNDKKISGEDYLKYCNRSKVEKDILEKLDKWISS